MRGRGNKSEIDLSKVEQYSMLGLSRRAIAELVGCDESTLRGREDCEKVYRSGRAKRLAAVAKAQWDSLKSGNVTMAIWLGKNELGQSDHPTSEDDPEPQLEPKVG